MGASLIRLAVSLIRTAIYDAHMAQGPEDPK